MRWTRTESAWKHGMKKQSADRTKYLYCETTHYRQPTQYNSSNGRNTDYPYQHQQQGKKQQKNYGICMQQHNKYIKCTERQKAESNRNSSANKQISKARKPVQMLFSECETNSKWKCTSETECGMGEETQRAMQSKAMHKMDSVAKWKIHCNHCICILTVYPFHPLLCARCSHSLNLCDSHCSSISFCWISICSSASNMRIYKRSDETRWVNRNWFECIKFKLKSKRKIEWGIAVHACGHAVCVRAEYCEREWKSLLWNKFNRMNK